MHPEHFFIVKRDFGPKIGWGYIGEDAKTFADCTDAIIESFDGCDVMLNADTVLVLEIDGGVALNRTQDALDQLYIYTTWRGTNGAVGHFTAVCYSGSDTAQDRGEEAA